MLRFSRCALVALLSLLLGGPYTCPPSAAERLESLKRDTDHLLELAQRLKDQVDKSSENTLSLDVLKKAEEIEKLAHSVKEKMKGY